jgi:hypothetical protein
MIRRRASSRRELLACVWFLCCASNACAGDTGNGDATNGASGAAGAAAQDASFATTVQPLFDQACNCHQSTPILMAPFSLKPGEAYANLVSQPSMQLASMPLVTPGALNQSYLWHKVNGTQLEVGGSGMIMPFTVPLVPDELRVIERWIAAGAPP